MNVFRTITQKKPGMFQFFKGVLPFSGISSIVLFLVCDNSETRMAIHFLLIQKAWDYQNNTMSNMNSTNRTKKCRIWLNSKACLFWSLNLPHQNAKQSNPVPAPQPHPYPYQAPW